MKKREENKPSGRQRNFRQKRGDGSSLLRDSLAKSTVEITIGAPYYEKIEGDELSEGHDKKRGLRKARPSGEAIQLLNPRLILKETPCSEEGLKA